MHVGVLPGDIYLEPRGTEESCEERPNDVGALDAIQPPLSIRAKQNAASHLHHFVGDAKGVHAPGEVEAENKQCDDHKHDERDGEREAAAGEPQKRIIVIPATAHHELNQGVAQVVNEVAGNRDQCEAALEQRGCGVKPMPLPVGKVDHRPARRLSARATNSSRRASASASGMPGTTTALAAAAVTKRNSLKPSALAMGPRFMSTSCMRP